MATDDGRMLNSVAETARALRNGDTSPLALLETFRERVERFNSKLNAFVTIDMPGAEKAAAEAEKRWKAGQLKSVFDGIPVAVKDLFHVQGVRTTAGSKIFADFVPEDDAAAIARLKAAGAVIVGMTNTHEFAFGTTTENPHYGPTRNPWDTGRVPGGSSGGSGAAVAAGLVPAATGTDTGGSIRIPAALCGHVGLKPTYGRVSRRGIFPLSWSLDHPGPMTRTVEDAALMLQIMAGPDAQDPTTLAAPPVPDFTEGLGQGVAGLKVGVPTRWFFQRVEPGVEAAVRDALNVLRDAGAQVVEVDWPDDEEAERIVAITSLIMSTEGATFHAPYLKGRADDYGADVFQRLDWGRHVLACEYLNAQRVRTLLNESLARVFQQVDVVATPTCPVTAFPIGTPTITMEGVTERAGASLVRFTRLANMTGWPAMSVPCGLDGRSLPVGLQIMGKPFDEVTVLRVGHGYEQARGPFPVPAIDA